MSTLREAAQQALEFIKATNARSEFWLVPGSNLNKTVKALKAALEQPEQEPVACPHRDEPRGCYRVRCQLGRKCVEPLYTHPAAKVEAKKEPRPA